MEPDAEPLQINLNTTNALEVNTYLEHHHSDGSDIEMEEWSSEGSPVDQDPASETDPVVTWNRIAYECPECGDRVTLRLMTKQTFTIENAGPLSPSDQTPKP